MLLQTKHKSRCRMRWPSGCIDGGEVAIIWSDLWNIPSPKKRTQWIKIGPLLRYYINIYNHFMGKNQKPAFFGETKSITFHFHLWRSMTFTFQEENKTKNCNQSLEHLDSTYWNLFSSVKMSCFLEWFPVSTFSIPLKKTQQQKHNVFFVSSFNSSVFLWVSNQVAV